MTCYQYPVSCLYVDHRNLGHLGTNWSPEQVIAAVTKERKVTNRWLL